ncbi:MAG TPA: MOSC N-terminal beta barrel domain-containing protein [Herpetosiphonaceae bacterium]|nr:MOSC N-terminal beta barrel domain-containing protein [Herpetosiphonaceae bacterium]
MTDVKVYAGSVVALWRYPVKSMQGEELDAAAVTDHGLLGDRAYALVDRATGMTASAKHPGKWARLFACSATYVEPPRLGTALPAVRITLPDGTIASSAEPDIDLILSNALGRDVTLATAAPPAAQREAYFVDGDGVAHPETVKPGPLAVAAPARTFFDYAVLHLLTTATLDRLHELYRAGHFAPRRFHPNLVVAPAADEYGFVENSWLGRMLSIGEGLRLHMIDPCPRCVVTTLPQGNLPHDPGILRTAARNNAVPSATFAPGVILPAVVGAYAAVIQGHTIRRGDAVWLGAPMAST